MNFRNLLSQYQDCSIKKIISLKSSNSISIRNSFKTRQTFQFPKKKKLFRDFPIAAQKKKVNKNVPEFFYTPGYPTKPTECKPQQLTAIGNRLLDWFSVIMADSKKRRQHVQKPKGFNSSIFCVYFAGIN